MAGHVTADGYTELGIGLISVGWMGKLHSRAYQAIPIVYPELGIRPRLVHAADTAPDRADYARDVLGYAKATTDYRDVLADPDVDVVSICAPNLLHREIGIAAAEAGKPFWIEKPVGRDAAETAAVAAAAAGRRGRHLDRLQLPPRPGGRADPRADRERRARPDHQRARGVLQRLRLRTQRRAVVAVQEGPGRQRRPRRPAQPRRRPRPVRRRADHRRHRTALAPSTSSARSCRWARARTSPSSRTVSWATSRTTTTRRALVRFAADSPGRRRGRHPRGVPGHRGPAVRSRLRDLRHRGLGVVELRADERAAARDRARRGRTRATPPSWATRPRATTRTSSPAPATRWATTTSRSSRRRSSSSR